MPVSALSHEPPAEAGLASVDAVLARMTALLEEFERKRDPRAVFLRSYRIITTRVRDRVAETTFNDAIWLAALDVEFARAYFDALEGYEAGKPIPRSWQLAFDRAQEGRTTVLADLVLGMNAHIFHDLPIAVYRLGLGSVARDLRQADYTLVDELLSHKIEEVQTEICRHYSFGLWLLDRAGRNVDELFTDGGLRTARALGWKNALALIDAPNETERNRLMGQLDETACLAGAAFHSGPFAQANWFTRTFRRIDRWFASIWW